MYLLPSHTHIHSIWYGPNNGRQTTWTTATLAYTWAAPQESACSEPELFTFASTKRKMFMWKNREFATHGFSSNLLKYNWKFPTTCIVHKLIHTKFPKNICLYLYSLFEGYTCNLNSNKKIFTLRNTGRFLPCMPSTNGILVAKSSFKTEGKI